MTVASITPTPVRYTVSIARTWLSFAMWHAVPDKETLVGTVKRGHAEGDERGVCGFQLCIPLLRK